GRRSTRVVEDDAERHARAGADRADAVSHDDAIEAAASCDGTMARREDDASAPLDGERVAARLRTGTLFDEQEFAARGVEVELAQDEDDLQRKREVAVEILMEAVETAGGVRQQKRCRPVLSGRVALAEKRCERRRVHARLEARAPFGV